MVKKTKGKINEEGNEIQLGNRDKRDKQEWCNRVGPKPM